MTNLNELAQIISKDLQELAQYAKEINEHPMQQKGYANKMQALSILSTLREAQHFGHPLVTNEVRYVACDGGELRVLENWFDAQDFIRDADPVNARLFGTAVIKVDPINNEYVCVA